MNLQLAPRWVALSMCVLALGAFSSGCGSAKTGSQGAQRLAKALTVSNNTFNYVIVNNLPDGLLRELGQELSTSVSSGRSIKSTLDKIAVSEDPYGKAITTALCTGIESLATRFDPNTQAEPTQQSWTAFLIAQVKVILPRNPVSLVEAAVNRFATAADLAESFHPRVAATYLQHCLQR